MASRMPAAAASGAMVAKCCRARISVGAMKAACRPASITCRRRNQRDHGLAGTDVAVQQPQHALRLRQIGDDVGDGALLRRRQRVGQRRDYLRAQPALGGAAAAGAQAHMGAQQARARVGLPSNSS